MSGTNVITGEGFQPGHGGNPGGRTKFELLALNRARLCASLATPSAVRTTVALMHKRYPPSVRLAAATAILDRALGRPHPAIDADGAGVRIRIELVDPTAPAMRETFTVLEGSTLESAATAAASDTGDGVGDGGHGLDEKRGNSQLMAEVSSAPRTMARMTAPARQAALEAARLAALAAPSPKPARESKTGSESRSTDACSEVDAHAALLAASGPMHE